MSGSSGYSYGPFLDEEGVIVLVSDIRALSDATYPTNASIASVYDSTSAYAVGDFCIKSGLLYVCNTAVPSGGESWNPSHWTQTSIANQLSNFAGFSFLIVKNI